MRALACLGALLLLVGAALAQEQPLERTGIEYRLYYWPGQETQAATVAEAAEAALPRLRQVLGLPMGERVDIHLAHTAAEWKRLTGGADPNLVLGLAFPERRVVVLQPLEGNRLRQLVVHELMHVLLQDKVAETGAKPPRWLHEGLAKYAANDFSATDRMLLTDAVNSGKLIPLADLDQAFAGRQEQVSLAYAESLTLVEFLANLEPTQGLAPFLKQLGQVGDVNRALLRAYHLTPQVFADRWRRHLLSEYLGKSNGDRGLMYIWAGIVVLFLLLFVARMRRSAVIRRRLEEEEQARQRMTTMWDLPARVGRSEQAGGGHWSPAPRDEASPEPEEDSDEWDAG